MAEQKKVVWREVLRGPRLESGSFGYQPLVTLTKKVYEMCQELCRKSESKEVGWFGTIDVLESQVLVDDIFLMEQQVGFASVDIGGLPKLGQRLIKEKRLEDLGRLHAWFHCHPGSGVSPSGQDEATYKELWSQAQGESILMGIFSKDATIAYFRLRHHGFDIPMTWRVVAPDTDVAEYFPNFSDLVKTEPVRVFSPACGEGFRLGGVGPLGQGAETRTTSYAGSPDQNEVAKRAKMMFGARNGRPMSVLELESLEKELLDAGYPESAVERVLERAINIYGLTNEKGDPADEEERKTAIAILKGDLGVYGLKEKYSRAEAKKEDAQHVGATSAEEDEYERWKQYTAT
jgi:hypothetical protein